MRCCATPSCERVSEARHVALHRQAAQALQALERSPARIGFHLVGGGNRSAAVPWMLRAAETEAALGAYREALDTLASVRDQAHGADLARLLGLRADLLMAGADAGAVDAYREALAATTDPALRSRLRARLARAASFAGDLDTAARRAGRADPGRLAGRRGTAAGAGEPGAVPR